MAKPARKTHVQRLKEQIATLKQEAGWLEEFNDNLEKDIDHSRRATNILVKALDDVKMENLALRRERDELRRRWESNVTAIRETYGETMARMTPKKKGNK